MKTRTIHGALALVALTVLAACDQAGLEPLADDLTAAELQEFAVLEDEAASGVVLEITALSADVATFLGAATASDGRNHTMQAQIGFAAARQALRNGERRRALELARSARRELVRATLSVSGPEAVDALIERIDDLSVTAGEDEDAFDDAAAIAAELGVLADAARDRLAAGDTLGAGERALLGEQRARYRRGSHDFRGDVHPARARLAVALAGTAVSLAERLIAQEDVPIRDAVTDVTDRQNRWLTHAKRLLERAETALANGNFARATHLAEHAHWSALKAVILPGGITEAEIKAMIDLAEKLYEQAQAAVGDDAPELEMRLLQRAGRLIEVGKARIEEGHMRGVAALWRASVICAWLLG